jgi:hypothetical protein
MFFAALTAFVSPGGVRYRGIGTIRGPWVWALSCVYIVVGVGLLRRSQWARLATIADSFLVVAFLGVALLNGLLQVRPIFLFAYLLRVPVSALTVWYLLKPEVGRIFTDPET